MNYVDLIDIMLFTLWIVVVQLEAGGVGSIPAIPDARFPRRKEAWLPPLAIQNRARLSPMPCGYRRRGSPPAPRPPAFHHA